MKHKPKLLFNTSYLIIALLLSGVSLFAQGGSNYSIFGLGDIVFGQTAAAQGMGGAQVAYSSDNTINMYNPALWAKVKTTRLQTGYRFNQNIIDNSNSTIWQNNGTINGFYSIFNFDSENEISAAVMMQPATSVNYNMLTNIYEIASESGQSSVVGRKLYTGTGGLNFITAGIGSKIISNVYVGASVSAVIGKIEHKAHSTFNNTYSIDYHVNNTTVFSGANYSFGLYINPISTLGVGAFYKLSPEINVENRHEYLYYPQTLQNRDTTVAIDNNIKMPDFFGIGLSYTIKRTMINVDYFSGDFKEVNIYETPQGNFSDLQRYSLGVCFLGNPNQFATMIDRISYKLGAYYQQQYYELNENRINEYALTGGLQVPIRSAQLDLAIAIGKRGTLSNGLLNESFGKLVIDISIGDNWFKPIKYDY